ncbi:hypothetical protein M0R45_005143 [Rubus argutus]|uniref:Uncharacterized protein n=1 Tax=Rubus argutus TaxID=59490 RepID=A0AAW1YLT0_RUBAR
MGDCSGGGLEAEHGRLAGNRGDRGGFMNDSLWWKKQRNNRVVLWCVHIAEEYAIQSAGDRLKLEAKEQVRKGRAAAG